MREVAIILLLLDAGALWHRATRDVRAFAAEWRGLRSYKAQRYIDAEESFSRADAARPTAIHAFNRGTAEIAAGRRDEGAETLARVIAEPSLRAEALYNRGNARLASGVNGDAIRDYIEVLKLRPADANAKRNLEVALRRDEAARRAAARQQEKESGSPDPKQPPASAAGEKPEPKSGEADAEALLRSVQQQEQEERMRMKRARRSAKAIGW